MNEIKLEQKKPVRIHLSRKKKLIIGGAVLLAALLAGGMWWWWSSGTPVDDNGQRVSAIACNKDIITKAGPMIQNRQGDQLAKVADEVMQKPNFDQDVNCLYIVIYNYINFGDGANARKYYEKLVPLYKPEVGFSQSFGPQLTSPEGLKRQIEFLEKSQNRPALVDEKEN